MKFAHIADVHLGTRRETPYLYDGFLNFIDYMELHPVDMIFITGDLFDHVPTKDDERCFEEMMRDTGRNDER